MPDAEKGLPPLAIETQCIGCGHPNPTGLHVAGCAEAQRKLNEPVRFASVDDNAESDAQKEAPHYSRVYRCQREGTGWADPPCSWSTTHYAAIDEHEDQIEPGHFVVGQIERVTPPGGSDV